MATRRVVIIGGGAIGSAIAYWLTADPGVHRRGRRGRARSQLSRSQLGPFGERDPPAILDLREHRIGLFGIEFPTKLGTTLAVGDERPEIGLVEPGYCISRARPGWGSCARTTLCRRLTMPMWNCSRPRSCTGAIRGLPSTVSPAARSADRRGLVRRLRADAGLSAKAIAQGARYLRRGRGVDRAGGGGSTAVQLGDGRASRATRWSTPPDPGRLGRRMVGIELPVRARARSVFVLPARPLAGCPLVIDPSGFWLRPEGRIHHRRPAAPARIRTTCRSSPTTRCSRRRSGRRLPSRSRFRGLRVTMPGPATTR